MSIIIEFLICLWNICTIQLSSFLQQSHQVLFLPSYFTDEKAVALRFNSY